MRVAVIGAGWAGCAAAVEAVRLGHDVTVYEASRTAGGRARRVSAVVAGRPLALDNGQHILIGAYSETLALMADVGVNADAAMLRIPLSLRQPNGDGLQLPHWPAPFDALAGIVRARGWSWADKLSLLQAAVGWQLARFQCAPAASVATLCQRVRPRVMASLIEPLCVSALNTPVDQASGQVFLRVLQDAMFGASKGSNLLLPKVDLSALLPDPALAWLQAQGATIHLGTRIKTLTPMGANWVLSTQLSDDASAAFDSVILACPPHEAARLATTSVAGSAQAELPPIASTWIRQTQALAHEELSTVYAYAPQARLSEPMLALPASTLGPAQFVFDRGQLGGPPGLLAFVISASKADSATLTQQVLAQGRAQLNMPQLQAVQTIVEKRATFACTPGLTRPGTHICAGLLACGDYIDGPYPATLEGAVRSGLYAARQLH